MPAHRRCEAAHTGVARRLARPVFAAYYAARTMWNWWTRQLWFAAAGPVIRAGRARPLSAADAPPLAPELEPRAANPAFDRLALAPFGPFIVRLFFAAGRPAKTIVVLTAARLVVLLSTPVLLHAVLARLPGARSAAGFPFALLGFALLLGLAGI